MKGQIKQFIGVVLVYELLMIFVHLAVYQTLAAAFGIQSVVLEIIFIVLAFSFMIAMIIGRKYNNRLVAWYFAAASYWFGLVNFLFAGSFAYLIITKILYSFNYYLAPGIIGAFCFGIFFLIHLYGTLISGNGRITKINVSIPHLPDAWKGRKIAFVSDIHLGDIWKQNMMQRVVNKVRALEPYALFIGGDVYDGPACDEEKLIAPLQSLHLPGGKYYVTGNHEYYLPDVDAALVAIKNAGVHILNNEMIDLDGMQLLGVDDHGAAKRDVFERMLHNMNIDKTKASILLKHVPLNIDVAAAAGVSFAMYGHTHDGQIYPLSMLANNIYKGFGYGLKSLGNMKVYTSSGVGTWGPPLRLGTKSEIVLVEFNEVK